LHQRAAHPARGFDAQALSPADDLRVNPNLAELPDGVRRHGRVIVLVEDDAGLRTALERVLSASGFDTSAHRSAEAALGDGLVARADCLVVDLSLPAMSGLDLVDCLRSRGVTAPAIVITAHDEARIRDEVRRRGIEHVLAKPFLGGALVRLVDIVVESSKRGSMT
jgi:FixJ family two-component response regulator